MSRRRPWGLLFLLVFLLVAGCAHDLEAADDEVGAEREPSHPAHPGAETRQVFGTSALSSELLFTTPARAGGHEHHHAPPSADRAGEEERAEEGADGAHEGHDAHSPGEPSDGGHP